MIGGSEKRNRWLCHMPLKVVTKVTNEMTADFSAACKS